MGLLGGLARDLCRLLGAVSCAIGTSPGRVRGLLLVSSIDVGMVVVSWVGVQAPARNPFRPLLASPRPLPGTLAADEVAAPSSSSNPTVSSSPSLGVGKIQLFTEAVNFCLLPTDTPLSGPSITKVLNEFANHVAKKILIGVDYCFGVRECSALMRYLIGMRYSRTSDVCRTWPFAPRRRSECSPLKGGPMWMHPVLSWTL
jgi:hypothetical protein